MLAPLPVYAQCSSPAGVAGENGYDLTGSGEMEYCNGTSWVSMENASVNTGDASDDPDVNGVDPVLSGPSLYGHWRLDETSGTSATDSSGNGNTGTLSGGLDAGTDSQNGQIDTAFLFNGTTDYIDAGSAASLDNITQSAGSISAWVYANGYGENSQGRIIDKASAVDRTGGWAIMYDNSPSQEFQFQVDYATQNLTRATDIVPLNQWTHVVVTWDGSTTASNVHIYYNGAEVSSYNATVDGSGAAPDDSSNTFRIGGFDGTYRGWDGAIDDVRVYDTELSAADVVEIYNAGNGGLVGHWKLDETTATTTAADSSISGNDGTMTSMTGSANTVSGRVGTALYFDGSDRITAGAAATNIDDIFDNGGTVAYWVYPENWGTFGRVVDKSDSGTFPPNNGWHTQGTTGTSGVIKFSYAFSTTEGDWESSSAALTNEAWNHVAITYDNSATTNDPVIYVNGVSVGVTEGTTPVGTAVTDAAQPVTLGARQGGGNAMTGRIDDVRLYDKPLSATDIAEIFDAGNGRLVGHWKLDETSGTSITDSSGQGNTGTFSGEANVVSIDGKINTALVFDGSNDQINAGSDSSLDDVFNGGGTLAAWIYPYSYGANNYGRILSKGSGGATVGWQFLIDGPQVEAISFHIACNGGDWVWWKTASGTLKLNEWSHVAVSFNRDSTSNTPTFYVNGLPVSSAVVVSSGSSASCGTFFSGDDVSDDLLIGQRSDANRAFDGIIDDARIYKRSLSVEEIAILSVCTKPGEMGYDFANHVLLWCDDNLDAYTTGTAGAGGGGCAASGSKAAGVEGTMQYDTANNKMVFCDGANWVDIPN